ncbi:tetratricopeptide repeat protein [Petrimonas sp.]|uniref:tetratricopeptide repeat protein n=1 Tax=Petrimonas sp. TaxID=2023866 RepID=UPI003F50ECF5
MKKLFFLTVMAVFAASSVFAQKSALRDAKRSLGSNDLNEARTLIKQATTNAETANDPETWKVYGDIGNKAFDNERTNQMLGKQANDKVMYDGLLESYAPYLKADSLGELPDDKGRVRNRVRKDISGILKANHPFYINGGIYYNEQQQYAKASDFFETYWNIPSLPMFAGQKDAFVIDSTFQTIKYYAILTAIQAQEHERALAMLQRIANEPFIENSAFKESDIYEIMAGEYFSLGDSASFLKAIEDGARKFPKNNYFTTNLVNIYIRQGDNQKAMEYLDQALQNDPSNACDLNTVKGSLLAEKGDEAGAEAEYNKALAQDPNCERAMESLARLFIVRAQEINEKAGQTTNRQLQMEDDKKIIELYQQALPLLEKQNNLMRARSADSNDLNSSLMLLRNVYYNLSTKGIDKSAQLKAVEEELGL